MRNVFPAKKYLLYCKPYQIILNYMCLYVTDHQFDMIEADYSGLYTRNALLVANTAGAICISTVLQATVTRAS